MDEGASKEGNLVIVTYLRRFIIFLRDRNIIDIDRKTSQKSLRRLFKFEERYEATNICGRQIMVTRCDHHVLVYTLRVHICSSSHIFLQT